ncbi:uncharacterized protein TRUGW13939_02731 [Talaromyces rugulosus]|uniref:RING-type domain-containing protein n=1 Tax=Talaromyces rugulosus TaxID=121627 RepID=A0A7H8QNU8_TALRU|nr:uncharacterized protein TRUGW13939_02731 [Talaromyces rugulosus]QKX55634.1 hypothetical protein TRUGW13939_02731 [Talaromyces rugulosus]
MPSYFYHIALELFSPPDRDTDYSSTTPQSSSLSYESAREALLPFQRRRDNKTTSRRSREAITLEPLESGSADVHGNTVASRRSADGRDQCPSSPSLPLRFAKDNFSTFENEHIQPDHRLDHISIQSIDMIAPDYGHPKRADEHFARSDEIATGIGTDILGGLHTKGKYVPLDQTLPDSIFGIVHLYRDAKETPSLAVDDYPSYLKGSSAARQPRDHNGGEDRQSFGGSSMSLPDDDCTTLCILAVPSYMSPSDFLGFVGEATRDEVSHFRMIKTARANRYMVLMKFRNGKKARDWQRDWNGKVFNSMEPETCHAVFVKSVEIEATRPTPISRISDVSRQSFSSTSLVTNPARSLGAAATSPGPSSTSLSTRPIAPPTPSLVELPTCPVCLERMDETTGLLTIICQHVFHCTCLEKWKGSGCPVCRYTLDDFALRSQVAMDGTEPECGVCHSELNLWICLICGCIGCGRYDEAHAFAHYKETSHAFAMDLSSQRVWDYVSDSYVHRIIQSKTDGKLVELPAADNSALDPPDWTDAVPREKLENMSVEYTHLLTSQLESQRAYFEEIVERAADKASKASAAASAALEVANAATEKLQDLQLRYDTISKDNVPGLEKEKDRAARRADKFEAMARKLEKEWREEKAMNDNLVQRVELLTQETTKLKADNADLTEQNRDLTFFISGSEKLKDQGDDVVEGTVSIPENSKRKGKGRRK